MSTAIEAAYSNVKLEEMQLPSSLLQMTNHLVRYFRLESRFRMTQLRDNILLLVSPLTLKQSQLFLHLQPDRDLRMLLWRILSLSFRRLR